MDKRYETQKKLSLWIIFIMAIFLIRFSEDSFADSVLVRGNTDSLALLANTKFLSGKPVLIFSEQLENRQASLLDLVKNIVFLNSVWQDLAIEFSAQSTIVYSPFGVVKVDKEGIHELWLDTSEFNTEKESMPIWKITVDKKTIHYKLQQISKKYMNIGEWQLKAGKHVIKIENVTKGDKKIKLLFLNKKERETMKTMVWRKINNHHTQLRYIINKENIIFFINPKESKLYNLTIKLKQITGGSVPVNIEQDKEKSASPILIKIEGKPFRFNDFISLGQNIYLASKIEMGGGYHKYETLKNDAFSIEWAILEPDNQIGEAEKQRDPQIIFKRINPTKYLVRVEEAKGPFWLVFSEGFDYQWKLYRLPCVGQKRLIDDECLSQDFKEIISDYPNLRMEEARHQAKITAQDIKFLFRKSMDAPHYVVNGYANGWYIEPDKLGLGNNFIFVIYFLPQSFSYLGMMVSILIWIACFIYLMNNFLKKKILRKHIQ